MFVLQTFARNQRSVIIFSRFKKSEIPKTQSKLSAPTLQNFVNGSLRANLNQAGIGLDSDRYHSIPLNFIDAYSWSSVVMDASRLLWETLQCRASNEPARSSGSQSWGAGALFWRVVWSCRRSQTTAAATGAIVVMTGLIVGVTVCAGFRTKALAVFKNGRWTACFTAAGGAGTLHDRCCHQADFFLVVIAVRAYVASLICLSVAEFSQILTMIITFVSCNKLWSRVVILFYLFSLGLWIGKVFGFKVTWLISMLLLCNGDWALRSA